MSIYAIAWAKKQITGSPTRKAVLTALADYADENGKGWPSVGRLAEDTELSVRAVRNALHELVEAGIISREDREAENGATKSCLYVLPIDTAKGRGQDVPGRGQDVPGGRVHVEGGGPRQDVHPHYVEPLLRTKEAPNGAYIEESKLSSHPKPAVWGSFEEFWMAYPAKVGKEAAKRKFSTVGKSGRVKFTDLMAALETYKAKKPHDRPWCYPTTWLNQGRWDDEHAAASSDERRRNYASV